MSSQLFSTGVSHKECAIDTEAELKESLDRITLEVAEVDLYLSWKLSVSS